MPSEGTWTTKTALNIRLSDLGCFTIVKFRKEVITNRVTDTCNSDSWSSPTSLLKTEAVRVSET